MSEYYILSIEWSDADRLTWWRPDNAGYTIRLEHAGVYSAEQVDAKPDYYNNGKSTLAIPKDVVDQHAYLAVETCKLPRMVGKCWYDGQLRESAIQHPEGAE